MKNQVGKSRVSSGKRDAGHFRPKRSRSVFFYFFPCETRSRTEKANEQRGQTRAIVFRLVLVAQLDACATVRNSFAITATDRCRFFQRSLVVRRRRFCFAYFQRGRHIAARGNWMSETSRSRALRNGIGDFSAMTSASDVTDAARGESTFYNGQVS